MEQEAPASAGGGKFTISFMFNFSKRRTISMTYTSSKMKICACMFKAFKHANMSCSNLSNIIAQIATVIKNRFIHRWRSLKPLRRCFYFLGTLILKAKHVIINIQRLDAGNLSEALCFRRLAVSGGLRNNLRLCVVNAGAPRIVKSKGHYTSEQPS